MFTQFFSPNSATKEPLAPGFPPDQFRRQQAAAAGVPPPPMPSPVQLWGKNQSGMQDSPEAMKHE